MPPNEESSVRRPSWAVVDPPLHWRSWDKREYVVYHSASGDTHLLNHVTAEVLRKLERSQMGSHELAGEVATALDCDLDEEFETYIERLLMHLDRIGLVIPKN